MTKPTVRELDQHLKDLVNWERFATHLPNIEQSYLDIIKKDEHDVLNQKLALYKKWLKVCPTASWNDVIQALELIEEHSLASNLKENVPVVLDVSSKSQVAIKKVKVSKDIVDELSGLHKSFSSITESVKSKVENAVDNGSVTMPRLVSRTKEEGPYCTPMLRNVENPHDYFEAIQPHYSFLNCHLIIFLAVFLSGNIAKRAKKYEKSVQSFKGSTQVNKLHNKLDRYFSRSVHDTSINVTIVLEKTWGKQKLWLVEELVKTLFDLNNPDECQWFKVKPGSVIVTFLTPKYLLMLYIVNSVKKLQFMRLIGIISLKLGSICILNEREEDNFSFDSSLIRATENSNIELVQFLLKFMQVNVNRTRDAAIGSEVIIIPNNLLRLQILQMRYVQIANQIESEVRDMVRRERIALQRLKNFIEEERPSYANLFPVNDVDSFLEAIKPFYNVFNYSLIVSIAQFLDPSSSVTHNAKVHGGETETFKTVVSVAHLKNVFQQYFQPSQPAGTIKVTILLPNAWQTCSVSMVEKLIQIIFDLKHPDELQWFKVISGSVIIVFFAPTNMKKYLINTSKKKVEFMRLLGVMNLKVGGDWVLKDKGGDYNIKKKIVEAKEVNKEAAEFLYKAKDDSIATTQQTYFDMNGNLVFSCDPDSTALMIACSNSDTRLVSLLLDNKADPNIETEGKSTALMYATMVGNAKIIKLLLK